MIMSVVVVRNKGQKPQREKKNWTRRDGGKKKKANCRVETKRKEEGRQRRKQITKQTTTTPHHNTNIYPSVLCCNYEIYRKNDVSGGCMVILPQVRSILKVVSRTGGAPASVNVKNTVCSHSKSERTYISCVNSSARTCIIESSSKGKCCATAQRI